MLDRTALRRLLAERFDDEELRTLCFDLGVDYEDLAGGTHEARARELVLYLGRRQALPQLIAYLRRTRPDIELPLSAAAAAALGWLLDLRTFSQAVMRRPLRGYQAEPAAAILDAVLRGRGETFAVMMCRQAGKNELSAHLEAYLLNLFQRRGGQLVKAAPTYRPQTLNSLLRLTERLENPWNAGRYRRREGYMVELGRARALFLSAEPAARVVGLTADLLLECDEAQDVREEKWLKDFVPMAAATNATRVLWGTAWTSETLLAHAIDDLRRLERRDGRRRVFIYAADAVGAEVPAYAEFVRREVARYGRQHPLVRTQYYLEPLDAAGYLFTAARQALMRGTHGRQHAPTPGHRYALLVDVGGAEEGAPPAPAALGAGARRDATALTVVEVWPQAGGLPHYRTVDRRVWVGTPHAALYEQILAQARHWGAQWLVVDATGIGAGLAAFLARALGTAQSGGKVIPVVFSARVKSDLGWKFLAVVETGRYQDYADDGAAETRQFWYEVAHCRYQVADGAAQTLRWGVWESPVDDGLVRRGHDDLLISAALCARLDGLSWPGAGAAAVVETPDALASIDQAGW